MTQQNKTSQQHLYFFLLPVNVLFIVWNSNTKDHMSADFFVDISIWKDFPLLFFNWNDHKQNFGLHLVLSIQLLVIIRSNEKNRTYLWELWGKTLGFSFFSWHDNHCYYKSTMEEEKNIHSTISFHVFYANHFLVEFNKLLSN